MAAACIVLNGPSCSGKSSIAAALQERWPRPLQSTGIDTFLASQSERFFWVVPQQPAWLERALSRASVLWVGVHCPLETIEQRERERGDRPVGAARGHWRLTHSFRGYDATVDTSSSAPEACAAEIEDRFRDRFPGAR